MVRLFICILLLGIGAAQYQLWLGRASWSRLSELRVILNTQREENESLRRTNEALQAEFNSLANNQDAIEERARRELNMVKPNEILFRIETTEEVARKSDAAASMPDVDAPDIAAGLNRPLRLRSRIFIPRPRTSVRRRLGIDVSRLTPRAKQTARSHPRAVGEHS